MSSVKVPILADGIGYGILVTSDIAARPEAFESPAIQPDQDESANPPEFTVAPPRQPIRRRRNNLNQADQIPRLKHRLVASQGFLGVAFWVRVDYSAGFAVGEGEVEDFHFGLFCHGQV